MKSEILRFAFGVSVRLSSRWRLSRTLLRNNPSLCHSER